MTNNLYKLLKLYIKYDRAGINANATLKRQLSLSAFIQFQSVCGPILNLRKRRKVARRLNQLVRGVAA